MADTTPTLERQYTIPLRREWTKVPGYKRTAKSITAIKEFIARHMKVKDRNLDLVKIDSYFNNHIWQGGSRNAPARVTVKAIKKGETVLVTFVDTPEAVAFARTRHERQHQKVVKAPEASKETKEESKTTEEKKVEAEKEKSTAIANEKIAEQQVKEQKHVAKDKMAHKKAPLQRMALQK
jgi:ribosomal protein L31E